MRTIIFSRAAVILLMATAGTSARAAEREQSFTHNGYTYSYTTTRQDDGATLIEGQRLPDREPFRLVVAKGRVSGRSGERPVAFRVADAKGAAGGVAATR